MTTATTTKLGAHSLVSSSTLEIEGCALARAPTLTHLTAVARSRELAIVRVFILLPRELGVIDGAGNKHSHLVVAV